MTENFYELLNEKWELKSWNKKRACGNKKNRPFIVANDDFKSQSVSINGAIRGKIYSQWINIFVF